MKKSTKRKRRLRKKAIKKGISVAKHVLMGMYELTGELVDMFIDPYGAFQNRPPDYWETWRKEQIYKAVNDLKEQKLIKAKWEAGRTLYALTEAGEYEIKKQLALRRITKKKTDGKWRVVIFDIPEDERHLRDNFRNLLKELGFKKLQASVWAHPYDVFDELESLIPDIKRHSWIKLLLVDVIVGERDFKRLFKTKS